MINYLYDGLHKLYYDIKGRDNIKPYLSFGYINGKIGNSTYKNFLFHIPLKISLLKQEIKIEYDTFTNKIFAEQNFTELLEEHFKKDNESSIEAKKKEILTALDSFNKQSNQFFLEKNSIRGGFYNTALEVLHIFPDKQDVFFKDGDLNYQFDSVVQPIKMRFSFSPIIQTKLVESKIAIANDAKNIAEKIFELKQLEQFDLIPDFFKKLFSVELTPEAQKEGDKETISNKKSYNNTSVIKPIRYLFPLPFNEEQSDIVKRLNEQDAVTVKGPPGTGKSHTIANLISHFVAEGKSILVVSHNAQALTVIKEKLPEGIQDLAISLANEGQGKETLKASVNAIITNISKRQDERKVEEVNIDLINLDKRYSSILEKIYN